MTDRVIFCMLKRFGKFLSTFLFLFSITPAIAQVGSMRNSFSFGASAGMGTSSVSFIPTIKQQLHPGLTAGIIARYTSEKYFWLISATQLEVNLSQHGWRELIEDGSGNEYSRVTNYIEIPFLTHLGFGREYRGFQGFLNLGPQIGYLIAENEIYGGTTPWDTSHRPNQVTEQYNKSIERKIDYGITGGVGLEMRTGMGIFSIEGRYYYGLSDIFNNAKRDYFARSANSTIAIKLGYLIQFASF